MSTLAHPTHGRPPARNQHRGPLSSEDRALHMGFAYGRHGRVAAGSLLTGSFLALGMMGSAQAAVLTGGARGTAGTDAQCQALPASGSTSASPSGSSSPTSSTSSSASQSAPPPSSYSSSASPAGSATPSSQTSAATSAS